MERQQAEQLLGAYLLDDLDSATRADVEAALAADAALRDQLADMRMAHKLLHLGLVEEPEPKLSEDRRLTLLAEAARDAHPSPRQLHSHWYIRWPVAVTAIAASILLIISITLPSLSRARSVHYLVRQAPQDRVSLYSSDPANEERSKAEWEKQQGQGYSSGPELRQQGASFSDAEMRGDTGDSLPFGMPRGEQKNLAPFGTGGGGGAGPSASLGMPKGNKVSEKPAQSGVSGEEQGAHRQATDEYWKSSGQKATGYDDGREMVDLDTKLQFPKPRFEGTPKNLPSIIDPGEDSQLGVGTRSGEYVYRGDESWGKSDPLTKFSPWDSQTENREKSAGASSIGLGTSRGHASRPTGDFATPLPRQPEKKRDELYEKIRSAPSAEPSAPDTPALPPGLPIPRGGQSAGPVDGWKQPKEAAQYQEKSQNTESTPSAVANQQQQAKRRATLKETSDQQVTRQLNQTDEKMVPYDDLLRYPPNWPDLSATRDVAKQSVRGEDEAVLAQMDRRLPELKFDNNGFAEVIDFLRDITGTSIFVNWKALEGAGIDRNVPVTARLRDVKFSKALSTILSIVGGPGNAKLNYTVDEGVITISTDEDLGKKLHPLRTKGDQITTTEQAGSAEQESAMSLPRASTFREVPVNPWVMTERDRFSTFASDVDSASYSLCRAYLRSGYLPPRGAVRMEEFINAFDYNYPRQAVGVFNVFAEGAAVPFADSSQGTTLLKIGVQGRVIGREGRKSAHLVFVIDTSGSMAKPDRLPLIQQAMKMLVGALNPNDRVSLVTYNRQSGLMLEYVPATNRNEIIRACNGMRAGGPTNLLAGLEAGYELARREFVAGRINRVILCTDGVANIGQTDAQVILHRVAAYRQNGITLTVAGFGQGGYNDELLETLAKQGDGSYLFIDTLEQARQVFVEKMNATLQTIALDARIQVEFNPQRVRRYRLIGYEKRQIADKDFRNDAIDAAEVGSGKSSTALYEVELVGSQRDEQAVPLGTVYVRYRNADTQQMEEISHRLESRIIRRPSVDENPRYYLAACAARFAEILRESPHAKHGNLQQISRVLERVSAALPLDNQARELLWMVKRAQGLPRSP